LDVMQEYKNSYDLMWLRSMFYKKQPKAS
jgi:hypothetical protein